MTKNLCYFLLFILVFQNARGAFCEDPSREEWIKGALVGIGSTSAVIGLRLVDTPTCGWCEHNAFDSAITNSLAWRDVGAARKYSDILAFGVAPFVTFSSMAAGTQNMANFGLEALILYDTLALTSMLTQIAKISFRRARPDAALMSNHSFWSGHTSMTFAMLSSATVLAFKNTKSLGPYMAASSALIGSLVGYLRIAGTKHWMSDVVVGMLVGVGVGTAMPFLILDSKSRTGGRSAPRNTRAHTPGIAFNFAW